MKELLSDIDWGMVTEFFRFADLIEPTELDNTNENQETGDRAFKTKDLVYLESWDEVKNGSNNDRVVYPTDYAVMCGACMTSDNTGPKFRKSTRYLLRSACSECYVKTVECDGIWNGKYPYRTSEGVRPVLHLNLKSFISARSARADFKVAGEVGVRGVVYYIEAGQYPKTYVGDKLNKELESKISKGSISITGVYPGYMKGDGTYVENYEYEYKGQKYVRVLTNIYDSDSEYSDGTQSPKGEYRWVKVEPIRWEITNWEDLPKEINVDGTGKAKTIKLRTEEAIFSGMPFYPNSSDKNSTMWQNSTIRGFLNGINVENIKTNGNTTYTAPNGGDFSRGNNFLTLAFGRSGRTLSYEDNNVEIEEEASETYTRKSRLQKLNPDTTPTSQRRKMTDTEKIKSWIDAGRSVLLRGPSGIGKTDRIRKLYPDVIYIKLTNNMFPEKVVGSMNLQTGQVVPPDYVKQALLAEATPEERKLIEENIQNLFVYAEQIYERSKTSKGKVVILLDELLNVKPAVQSLVYTLVLNKFVETGKGLKLPANTVIVATGNQKKYSAVSEDLAEPLEKRFDHILDMEPKVGEWLYEYAIPNKLHPSVIGFIFSKYQENLRSEEISEMGYFYEEPEVGEEHLDKNGCRGRTNDPRGWTSISSMLYSFEKDLADGKFIGKDVENLLETSINSKLREEWAKEFFDFYNNPTLTVEDVVNKRYTQADLPRDTNEKFATMAGLLSADETEVKEVREFIRKYCDPEYLSVYDIYWAGQDENRMEKLVELQALQTANKTVGEGRV